MIKRRLLARGLAFVSITGLAIGALAYVRPWAGSGDQAAASPTDTRVSEKLGGTLKLKSPLLAESYGIAAEPAHEVMWHPKLFVDGRVVVNPLANVEIRAPFAGVISTAGPFVRLGATVEARQILASIEARFNLVEKLDLKSKRIEAEARYRSAADVLKIRQERLDRLGQIPASVSRSDVDSASIQLSEAKMLHDSALAQWDLWKQALESPDKTGITVPLITPLAGEIVEVYARPGSYVEAGQSIARVVDLRQILVRLDFPVGSTSQGPPQTIEVEPLSAPLATPVRWQAQVLGTSANVEIALQKASYLFEVIVEAKNAPPWRPGLYIKANLPDPTKKSQPVVAIPASALLVHQGRTLVYIELNVGRYERREVVVLDREADRFYVSPQGWTSTDDRVVFKHAQVLLSEEFRSDVDDD